MSLAFYKILHLAGLSLVLVALGGATLNAFRSEASGGERPKKALLGATHGTGLLIMFVAGFGMLHKLGGGLLPGWIHPKLLLWVLLGAALPLINRKPKLATVMWWALPLIVAAGAAAAIYKPGA